MFGGALHFISNLFHGQQAQKQGGGSQTHIPQPNSQGAISGSPMNLNTQTLGMSGGYKTGYIQPQFVPSPEAVRAGGAAINRGNLMYHYTPAFLNNIESAQPVVTPNSKGGLDSGGGLKGNMQAAGLYYPGMQFNSIRLANDDPGTITHEGLHRIYNSMSPQQKSKFNNAYNKSVTPGLAAFLQNQLGGYSASSPNSNYSNINSLPPSIQNEVHSYIPEYYDSVLPSIQSIKNNPKIMAMVQQGKLPGLTVGMINDNSQPASLLNNEYSPYIDINHATQMHLTNRMLLQRFNPALHIPNLIGRD